MRLVHGDVSGGLSTDLAAWNRSSIGGRRYNRGVADDKIWTAAELEELEPNDHRRLFNERVVTDLSEVSPEFLARARSAGRALLEARGVLGKPVG